MKAAVFSKPGEPLTIQDVERPQISDNEMLVKVARCGICGTDIHASREGPFMAPPNTVFGHEFSGEIVEIGKNISQFKVGDRVTSLPFIGEQTIGLGQITGAYSEFVKVGEELVVNLPDGIDDQQGALVEPLAVGLHSVKMAGSVAEKDVLIIGAGPIGLTCAIWATDTRMRIVCLEQGGRMNPAEYPSTGREWETATQGDYAISPNIRKRPADYPINEDDTPISVANFNGVGGSTILYSAHFPRMHPSDFKVKSLDGVADDWPIDYNTLEPFYAENDRNVGVSGLAGGPADPPHQPPLPHIPMGHMGEKIATGFNALGWHWWPSDSAIITRDYDGREACANLGPCNTGCAKGAKSSADVTYWPMAERQGVELRTGCRVREITVDENDMATGAIYFDEDGIEHFQRAEIVIMACNGVGTPRLLLNSKSARFPDGLANRSGLVGQNLMFHPWGNVQGVFDEPLASHYGPQGCCILSKEFYETDLERGFVRGYNMQITRGAGPISTAMGRLASGDLPWGEGHHGAFAKYFDRTINLGICCEDLPETSNAVTLDPTLCDSNGIPAPKVTYRFSENSQRMLQHGLARGVEVMQAAGATDISTAGPLRLAGWHLLGTARMGTDPESSVVNEWGRSHDVRNLFIVDGSVFVTSGGVNPTTTIQAVALYIADAMKKRLANLFD